MSCCYSISQTVGTKLRSPGTVTVTSLVQVPVWDMLNHITGQCNIRLHHSSKRGALQMITIKPVNKGEELVNSYGPLSDSELLRRFGFIEAQPNPHNGCEIPLAMIAEACQAHCSELKDQGMLDARLKFFRQHELVPTDGWFRADAQGKPLPELVEVVRILLLSSADFVAFEKQVDQWRCPLSRPLATLATVCPAVQATIRDCATRHLTGFAVSGIGCSDSPDNLAFRAAQHVVDIEQKALYGLHLWLERQTGSSLASMCTAVWHHVRTVS